MPFRAVKGALRSRPYTDLHTCESLLTADRLWLCFAPFNHRCPHALLFRHMLQLPFQTADVACCIRRLPIGRDDSRGAFVSRRDRHRPAVAHHEAHWQSHPRSDAHCSWQPYPGFHQGPCLTDEGHPRVQIPPAYPQAAAGGSGMKIASHCTVVLTFRQLLRLSPKTMKSAVRVTVRKAHTVAD